MGRLPPVTFIAYPCSKQRVKGLLGSSYQAMEKIVRRRQRLDVSWCKQYLYCCLDGFQHLSPQCMHVEQADKIQNWGIYLTALPFVAAVLCIALSSSLHTWWLQSSVSDQSNTYDMSDKGCRFLDRSYSRGNL